VGTLASVNVGMPKHVPWQGKTVFTGVFKEPVAGPRRVSKLNVDGDGQGDLAGHGGEQRAVFVYQLDSYRYWERELGRNDLTPGQFGENFTIDGPGDDEICIGDHYPDRQCDLRGHAAPGHVLPRRDPHERSAHSSGARLAPPSRLLLPRAPGGRRASGRRNPETRLGPGANDRRRGRRLLYLPGHPRQQLLKALRISALSPGWQTSFRALLEEHGSGNAGLTAASPPPAWPGFRRLIVTGTERESDSVISIRLENPGGKPVPAARPGQYLTVRLQVEDEQRSVLRNYSLSGPPGADYYRITVKREPDGVASGYLHSRLAVGDQLEIAAPRGTFILGATDAPVLLISAGIGATPVLAMLHALAEVHSDREIWWLHGARSRNDHSFAVEARALLAELSNAHAHVYYSRPGPRTAKAATSTASAVSRRQS
jgi:ferredoxin-NADP reductase